MKEITPRTLLTLAIPTFNRFDCLRLLIESVIHQLPSEGILGEKLELLVCNNASTDGTTNYLNSFANIKGVRVIHHSENRGAVANIIHCCEAAESKYLWIMGDDDVPLEGAILAVIECLERDNPDLVYLPAYWVTGDLSSQAKGRIKTKDLSELDRLGLAVCTSVHVTFISSWILNMDAYKSYSHPPRIDRYRDTSLPHLEWIFTLLVQGKKFLCANDDWIIARGGSSGGYVVFDVFSRQYVRIVDEKLMGNFRIHGFFRRCMLWRFIPSLVWGVRQGTIGRFGSFKKNQVVGELKAAYGNDLFFIFFVVPIVKFYRPVAWCFRIGAGVWGKVWLYWSRKRAVAML